MRGDGGSGQRVSDSVSGCVFVHVCVVWMWYRQSSIWSFLVVSLFIYLFISPCLLWHGTAGWYIQIFVLRSGVALYTLCDLAVCWHLSSDQNKGSVFFLSLFFLWGNTLARLRRTRIVGRVSEQFVLYFLQSISYVHVYEVFPSGLSVNESIFYAWEKPLKMF